MDAVPDGFEEASASNSIGTLADMDEQTQVL